MGLFQMRPLPVVDEPERPSHFGEDQNERVPEDQGAVDYRTDEPESPEYGFQPSTEAIPVYLTEPAPNVRPIRKWQGNVVTVTGGQEPVQILTNDRNRTRAVVVNLDDADPVYLSATNNDNPGMFASRLGPGKEIEFLHNSEVWLYTTGVLVADVSYHVEWEMDPQ